MFLLLAGAICYHPLCLLLLLDSVGIRLACHRQKPIKAEVGSCKAGASMACKLCQAAHPSRPSTGLQVRDLEEAEAALCKLSSLQSELLARQLCKSPGDVLVQDSQGTATKLLTWLSACQSRLRALQAACNALGDSPARASLSRRWRATTLPDQQELRREACTAEAAIRMWLVNGGPLCPAAGNIWRCLTGLRTPRLDSSARWLLH